MLDMCIHFTKYSIKYVNKIFRINTPATYILIHQRTEKSSVLKSPAVTGLWNLNIQIHNDIKHFLEHLNMKLIHAV